MPSIMRNPSTERKGDSARRSIISSALTGPMWIMRCNSSKLARLMSTQSAGGGGAVSLAAVGSGGVLVAGTGVLVGGTGVLVGGTGVLVGGTGVLVGGTGVLVSVGGGVLLGVGVGVSDGTGVSVGGIGVSVGRAASVWRALTVLVLSSIAISRSAARAVEVARPDGVAFNMAPSEKMPQQSRKNAPVMAATSFKPVRSGLTFSVFNFGLLLPADYSGTFLATLSEVEICAYCKCNDTQCKVMGESGAGR
jgi:hypothetical protein